MQCGHANGFVYVASRLLPRTLDAQLSQTGQAVARRLLAAMCDSVVHLDGDLKIQRPSPALEALLLKHDTANGLSGTPFVDLLVSEERDRFTLRLRDVPLLTEQADDPAQEELACCIPTKMRDVWGSKVPVHIFYVAYQDISCQTCYVLGVQEDKAEERFVPSAIQQPRRSASVEVDTTMNHHHQNQNQPIDELCSSEVVSDRLETVSDLMVIDCASPQLTVLRCCTSLMIALGPVAQCERLMPLIDRRQRHEFHSWCSHSYNQVFHDNEDELSPFDGLILRPAHLATHHIWLEIDVCVRLQSTESGDEEEDVEGNAVLWLELPRIEFKSGEPKSNLDDRRSRRRSQRNNQVHTSSAPSALGRAMCSL